MNSRASEFAVGLLVILFAGAMFFLAMNVSGLVGNNLKQNTYTMTATFNNINGLKERAKVTMSGVTIGRVERISLDPVTRLAKVEMLLDGNLTTFNAEQLETVKKQAVEELKYSSDYEQASPEQQKEMETQLLNNMTSITNIDEDAYIMVATNGLLGEKYLKVVPGGGLNYIKRDSSIGNTQGTMDLEDLISKFITGGGASKLSGGDAKDSKTEQDKASTSDEPSFTE